MLKQDLIKIIVYSFFIFDISNLNSQNLIYNGSFEKYSSCPENISQIYKAIGWYDPNPDGTSDYFNKCSKEKNISVPNNLMGKSYPKGGNCYAGFGLSCSYGQLSYEFIETMLFKKLKKDKQYCLKFYVKFPINTLKFNELSCVISKEHTKVNKRGFYTGKQISEYGYYPIKVIDSTGKYDWNEICTIIKPNGQEQYLTIGFNKFVVEQKVKKHKDVYCYIDEINLIEINNNEDCLCNNEKLNVDSLNYNNKAISASIIMENTVFEINKCNLLITALEELNDFIFFLKQNERNYKKQFKIELSGYTDDSGKEEFNLLLSEKRAKTVADYLIKNGIQKERISYKGCGSKEPLVPNNSLKNKSKNRRVEVKLIE